MSKLKPYDSYKDSNVEWIGAIPSEWKVSKIKYQSLINSASLSEATNENYVIQYIDIGNVDSNGNIINIEQYKFGEAPSRARRMIKDGDTIVSTVRTYLRAIASIKSAPENLVCSTGFAVLSPKNDMSPIYLAYLVRSTKYVDEIVRRSTGVSYPATTSGEIGKLECILPDKYTQKIIGNYLDDQTSEIDSLIDAKEKLIELLEEKRKAIITEVVTKGLNPDVKIKDSGVEAIGEIPEHWEVKRLNYLGSLQNGISKSSEEFGFGYPFVSYGDVYKNMELPETVIGLVNSSNSDRNTYSVRVGDVFFTRTSETIEEIGIASTCLKTIRDATFAGFLIRFRPNSKRLVTNFAKYFFRSDLGRKYFVKEMNLVTRASLSQDLLKKFPVTLPPIEEQEQIASYLDIKTEKILESKTLLQEQIEKLKEYRQALIYEAVSGKIDVRDYKKVLS